jgi:hypothetical protein
MKNRFRLMRRGIRGGAFYCVDTHTGKRTSLGTTDEEAAEQILLAKNQAERQPILNLQIAKAYIAGTDSGITTRTWKDALDAITATKKGPTRDRWETAGKDKALKPLLPEIIIETKAEAILSVIQHGKVSTNVYLRRLHNFCVDLNWLPWPIVPKRQWPAVQYKETLRGRNSQILTPGMVSRLNCLNPGNFLCNLFGVWALKYEWILFPHQYGSKRRKAAGRACSKRPSGFREGL